MKLLTALLLIASASLVLGQTQVYSETDTEILSSASTALTLQVTSTTNRTIILVGAYVYCSAACTLTIEKSGTAATATAIAPVKLNSASSDPVASVFKNSDVGVGSVIGTYTISAGSGVGIDLSSVVLPKKVADNLTLRIGSMTGTVNLVLQHRES